MSRQKNINELEDRTIEIIQFREHKEKRLKKVSEPKEFKGNNQTDPDMHCENFTKKRERKNNDSNRRFNKIQIKMSKCIKL